LVATPVLFIVNDRADMALAVGADGVHVGQDELPVEVVRAIVGPERLIGLSTHSAAQVQAAQATSANYLGLGPVFPSGTKNFTAHVGTATLAECLPLLERPTFAIGGIQARNVAQVHSTGIHRVAVQGALAPGSVSAAAVQQLRVQP
jgi:thiamine-phosphate pyrophosphorylase